MNKIYCGDCFGLLPQIEPQSINLIFADLPYAVTAQSWDERLDLNILWNHFKRIIKDNGIIIFTATQPFTTDIINSNREWFRYCWYWQKNQGTNFFHARRMPIRKIEEVLVFYKDKYIYNPQITKNHVPTRSAKGCSNGKVYYGKNKRNYEGGSTERYPTNILNFKCVNNYKRIHPNEKPAELIEYLIRTYTNEGDIVLDPVAGSGVTGEASLKTNRKFILIEKDEKYCEQINNRLSNLK